MQKEKVFGWIHIARMGSWRTILSEQIKKIESSGILKITSAVYACLSGPHEDFPYPLWMTILKEGEALPLGEAPTIQQLWDFSKELKTGKVWYIHTKGASYNPPSKYIISWRQYMESYNLDKWSDCLEALKYHDICGIEWWTALTNEEKKLHKEVWGWNAAGNMGAFVGNFWWANIKYIANLPIDRVDLLTDRWGAEWRFLSVGSPKVKCFIKSGKNLYKNYPVEIPRTFSDDRLEICQSCEYYNEERFACNRCGCSFKTTLYDPNKVCPINKWGVVPTPGIDVNA